MFYISSWSKSSGDSESAGPVPVPCHIRHELKRPCDGGCDGCKKTSPNRECYISSWPEFQGGSKYPIRNLKFSQWHPPWPYRCFSHILRKYDLGQLRRSICHQDLIFKGISDLNSEIWNFISGIGYGNISVLVLVRFWENMTFTNHDDLYIIRTWFSRGFWISTEKI